MSASPDLDSIADIRKNTRETYRIRLGEFNGHRFADLRIWFGLPDALKPSAKGVTIKPEALPAVIAALQEAQKRLAGAA